MNDSNEREDSGDHEKLAEKHRQNREQRIEAIKRWVAYVKRTPPEKWGEQQNALIESQLESARGADVSAEQHRRVERAADERERDLED